MSETANRMRSRAEVEKAVEHLRGALRSPLVQAPGGKTARFLMMLQIEILQWTMGKENRFADAIRDMEAVDRTERQ